MMTIDANTLQQKIEAGDDMILIDVREPFEHELFNIGGLLIPLNNIFENLHQLKRDKPVIFYCQKGIRSQIAIQRLEQKFNYTNLVNLSGGMEAWKKLMP